MSTAADGKALPRKHIFTGARTLFEKGTGAFSLFGVLAAGAAVRIYRGIFVKPYQMRKLFLFIFTYNA